jgi:hypothetical protein
MKLAKSVFFKTNGLFTIDSLKFKKTPFIALLKILGILVERNLNTSDTNFCYIGPSNKYIFRVGVGDILILLTV